MQTTELQTLQTFESGLKKSDIKSLAISAVDSCLESGNVLKVAEALSGMEAFIKEVKDDKRFTDYVREETAKTPKGFVSNSGAKIELAEVGTKYDFSQCNDPELTGYEADMSIIKDLVDVRKEFLKNVPVSGLDILTKDGEVVKVYPPSKSSSSSFKVTLAK